MDLIWIDRIIICFSVFFSDGYLHIIIFSPQERTMAMLKQLRREGLGEGSGAQRQEEDWGTYNLISRNCCKYPISSRPFDRIYIRNQVNVYLMWCLVLVVLHFRCSVTTVYYHIANPFFIPPFHSSLYWQNLQPFPRQRLYCIHDQLVRPSKAWARSYIFQ